VGDTENEVWHTVPVALAFPAWDPILNRTGRLWQTIYKYVLYSDQPTTFVRKGFFMDFAGQVRPQVVMLHRSSAQSILRWADTL
jgi:hypothetical protein